MLAAAEDTEELHQNDEIEFSPKYQRFRKRFLKDPFRYARRKKKPVWKKVLQTAACLLLASIIGLGAVMTVSPSACAEIIRWIRMVTNTDVSYNFFAEPTNQVPPRYEIGDLPDGFVEIEYVAIPKSSLVIYQNAEGQRITFQYMYMEDGVSLGIDTKNVNTVDIEVNGCSGYFYFVSDETDSSAIAWIDEQEGLLFSLDMWGTIDEILPVAESVFLSE